MRLVLSSQATESCKQQRSSGAVGALAAGIGQLESRDVGDLAWLLRRLM